VRACSRETACALLLAVLLCGPAAAVTTAAPSTTTLDTLLADSERELAQYEQRSRQLLEAIRGQERERRALMLRLAELERASREIRGKLRRAKLRLHALQAAARRLSERRRRFAQGFERSLQRLLPALRTAGADGTRRHVAALLRAGLQQQVQTVTLVRHQWSRSKALAREIARLEQRLAALAPRRQRIAQRRRTLAAALSRVVIERSESLRRLAALARRRADLARLEHVRRRAFALALPSLAIEAASAPLRAPVPRLARGYDRHARPSIDIAAARLPPALVTTDPGGESSLVAIAPFPVRLIARFGEGSGPLASGVALETELPQAVRTPRPGRVAFAGPFRDFGAVLILEHGGGYHTLIAGLSRLAVRRGARVRFGDVLGYVVPEGEHGRRLYVELRHRGRTIDPLPWLRPGPGA